MSQTGVQYRSPTYYEIESRGSSWRDHRSPEYWEYRRLWEERPAKRDPGDFPLHVDIDPTNACNLKCTMCPRTHYLESGNTTWAPNGKIGFMDFALYQRVIDQAAAGGAFSIKLNFLGEPLLHPDVVKQTAYAHDHGLEVMMNTNATLLSAEMSEELIRAGVDDIFFSVDSPYAEEYEAIRAGANFENVIDNIAEFVRIKERLGARHIQTRASMVVHSMVETEKAREDFKNLFEGLGVAEIGFGLATEMDVDYWEAYGFISGFACRDLYQRMFVYWDGKIGPCCGEWERAFLLGDTRTDDLAEVWLNERYQSLRRFHEQGRYDRMAICRKCSVPWLSTLEVAP